MRVLGISPLDRDATVSLVEDGKIIFAAAEERFSRKKMHAGFPYKALECALAVTKTSVDDIDHVVYAFLPWEQETELVTRSIQQQTGFEDEFRGPDLARQLDEAEQRVPSRNTVIPGLQSPNQKKPKTAWKEAAYRAGAIGPMSKVVSRREGTRYIEDTKSNHRRWQEELLQGLEHFQLADKLRRYKHHLSHAANAYLSSGFERPLIVTVDGYGSGLAGSIALGENGSVCTLSELKFPNSLGSFYEAVTSSLGFNPERHAGKIVGLAAYGDPAILSEILLNRIVHEDGAFRIYQNLNLFFTRHLAARFPMIDVAAAYQHVLERVVCDWIRPWLQKTGTREVVLSGGVAANVKMNQRVFEIDGVERLFVYPNMGDGGCASGAALHLSWPGGGARAISDVYLGPEYTDTEIRAALDEAGLKYQEPADLAREVASRIHAGEVVGRFNGRMEYGPRALGNRSILYHAGEAEVNQWLNKRLGRTEFMPFAPVTLWEARERCYVNVAGKEHTAEFMTVTFDCTDYMRKTCPAAVHVDGTARPQLIRRENNPGYYDILKEYEKLSGVPCLINTSFNMHEEPIVCSPGDAIRAFLLGHLDGLAIGNYYVENPNPQARRESSSHKA
jgi:carbamoyltransferase